MALSYREGREEIFFLFALFFIWMDPLFYPYLLKNFAKIG